MLTKTEIGSKLLLDIIFNETKYQKKLIVICKLCAKFSSGSPLQNLFMADMGTNIIQR